MRFFSIISWVLALAAWCPRALTQTVDSLQAVVNDRPVTQQQIEKLVSGEQQMLYSHYSSQPDVFKKKMQELWQDASESLVTRQIILHEFKENIKVPDSIIEQYVDDRIKELYPNSSDRVELTKKLELEGTTMGQFRREIRERFIVEQMRFKFVPEPIISPLKIENYYVAHRETFKLEDQIKMRMIFLNLESPDAAGTTRKRADELHTQIKGGASFDQLARVYSEGSLKQEGGETGWEELSVVNKVLLPEIARLKPGEYSNVIEAPEGFYLLMLEDRQPAHYRPLGEVREQVEKTLAAAETERLSQEWIGRLRKKTFIKYF